MEWYTDFILDVNHNEAGTASSSTDPLAHNETIACLRTPAATGTITIAQKPGNGWGWQRCSFDAKNTLGLRGAVTHARILPADGNALLGATTDSAMDAFQVWLGHSSGSVIVLIVANTINGMSVVPQAHAREHQGTITSMEVSSCGTMVVTASMDGAIAVWDAAATTVDHTAGDATSRGSMKPLRVMEASTEGPTVAMCACPNTVASFLALKWPAGPEQQLSLDRVVCSTGEREGSTGLGLKMRPSVDPLFMKIQCCEDDQCNTYALCVSPEGDTAVMRQKPQTTTFDATLTWTRETMQDRLIRPSDVYSEDWFVRDMTTLAEEASAILTEALTRCIGDDGEDAGNGDASPNADEVLINSNASANSTAALRIVAFLVCLQSAPNSGRLIFAQLADRGTKLRFFHSLPLEPHTVVGRGATRLAQLRFTPASKSDKASIVSLMASTNGSTDGAAKAVAISLRGTDAAILAKIHAEIEARKSGSVAVAREAATLSAQVVALHRSYDSLRKSKATNEDVLLKRIEALEVDAMSSTVVIEELTTTIKRQHAMLSAQKSSAGSSRRRLLGEGPQSSERALSAISASPEVATVLFKDSVSPEEHGDDNGDGWESHFELSPEAAELLSASPRGMSTSEAREYIESESPRASSSNRRARHQVESPDGLLLTSQSRSASFGPDDAVALALQELYALGYIALSELADLDYRRLVALETSDRRMVGPASYTPAHRHPAALDGTSRRGSELHSPPNHLSSGGGDDESLSLSTSSMSEESTALHRAHWDHMASSLLELERASREAIVAEEGKLRLKSVVLPRDTALMKTVTERFQRAFDKKGKTIQHLTAENERLNSLTTWQEERIAWLEAQLSATDKKTTSSAESPGHGAFSGSGEEPLTHRAKSLAKELESLVPQLQALTARKELPPLASSPAAAPSRTTPPPAAAAESAAVSGGDLRELTNACRVLSAECAGVSEAIFYHHQSMQNRQKDSKKSEEVPLAPESPGSGNKKGTNSELFAHTPQGSAKRVELLERISTLVAHNEALLGALMNAEQQGFAIDASTLASLSPLKM